MSEYFKKLSYLDTSKQTHLVDLKVTFHFEACEGSKHFSCQNFPFPVKNKYIFGHIKKSADCWQVHFVTCDPIKNTVTRS